MTVAELASTIAHIDGVAPRRGAQIEEIRAAELRLGVSIPPELCGGEIGDALRLSSGRQRADP